MLCGVTATLGSNPSATATAARPHWGRAVLLCLAGVPCGCVVPLVLLVAPWVFRAPEGPAAREARRPHFVRRRASKPARALRSLRRPPHRRCLRFWCARGLRPAREPSAPRALLGASSRSPARPRRRPRSPQPGPAAHSRRSQASASSGALHTSGACRSGVPGQALPPTLTNFARNSPATVSNLECASLELQRFQRLLKLLSIELRASFPGPAVYRELRQPVRG